MSEFFDRASQSFRFARFAIFWAGACLLVAATAWGQDAQPIAAPAIISDPGTYVLVRGRRFAKGETTPAVVIRGHDVVLDLNGQTLSGPETKMGVGISVEGTSNVAIRNGIVSGFGIGVQVLTSNNVRIDGLQIQGRDLGGAPPDVEVGVLVVNSRAVVVENNIVSRTFLGVFVRGGASSGNRIANNTLVADQNGMIGICYNPAMAEGAAGPKGDLVYNNLVSRFPTGISLSTESTGNIIRNNTIAYRTQGISETTAGSNRVEGNLTAQIP